MGDLSPQVLNFNRLLLGLVPKLETSENLQIKNPSFRFLAPRAVHKQIPMGKPPN